MERINTRNLIIFVITLTLILSLALSVGCVPAPKITPSPPSSPPASQNSTPIASSWTPPKGNQTSPLPSIADVVTKVKPSVVAINVEITTYDFFNRPRTQEGAGSGWIIDKNGIIVTNNHVVEGAKNITVILEDGRTFPVDMKTVATDPLTDLAIVKIDAENLPAATVGDSLKLRVGDWVVAIGNSLGRGIRATVGIVSQLGVSLQVDQGQTLYNLIDTSATINLGNSGGPLVNLAGEVVGITSAKIVATGAEATGFAITSQEAMPVIEQLITTGYVVRPWLGVELYTVDQYAVFRYNLAIDKGVLVTTIVSGSPADKAGLQAGDVITKFKDQEITEASELVRAIHSSQVEQKVEITFWRGQTEQTTSATLTESPPPS